MKTSFYESIGNILLRNGSKSKSLFTTGMTMNESGGTIRRDYHFQGLSAGLDP